MNQLLVKRATQADLGALGAWIAEERLYYPGATMLGSNSNCWLR